MTKSSKVLQEQQQFGAHVAPSEQVASERGQVFTGVSSVAVVAPAADNDLLLLPDPANGIMPRLEIGGTIGDQATFSLFENPTVTANGTPVPLFNRKRSDPTPAVSRLFQDPTITAVGTLIYGPVFITPGGKDGERGIGQSSILPHEWILRNDVPYLMRLTNDSVDPQRVTSLIQIVEILTP